MKISGFAWFALLTGAAAAQGTVTLPELTVYSPRVANQEPAGALAMPVSLLRYEPGVDIQPRNLAEGQADVTIRGGIFENTAFQVGALTLADPQTGHYFAELPIAPALLTAPKILVGPEVALQVANATAGAVAYGWKPVRDGGFGAIGGGEFRLRRGELYQGVTVRPAGGGARFGADVSLARSESDGPVRYGEHEFDRANLRLQRASGAAQTDLFAGYQAKRFGWPNLYTPFNSNETENLQTVLFAANHRADLGAGRFFEAGAYHRRNKDDYAFNRFSPLGPVHPFQHTTWVTGATARGRAEAGEVTFDYRAEILSDEIRSTSLVFGRYRTRTLTKLVLAPERSWAVAGGDRLTVRAGVSADDTNRDSGSVSPVLQLARTFGHGLWRQVFASYSGASQVPTYTALNSNAAAGLFRGNPNLGRQRSRNLEAGFVAERDGWSATGAAFWRRDEALVDWTFRRGVTARTANPVDVDVTGVEVVARRSWRAVDAVLGYTFMSKDADYRGAPVDASFYALNHARHRVTAALVGRTRNGFELRLDNVARWQAPNLLRTVGGDHVVSTTAGLSYRPMAWRGTEILLSVENLWNSDFQDVPGVPAAPRQIAGTLRRSW